MKRTVIITGANRGIGLAAVKTLAKTEEWNIIMACRSIERAETERKLIKYDDIEICELDLSDLQSVRNFALSWGSKPLHVLANNAGIQKSTKALGNDKNPIISRTKQGFEETIGTNHLGHFYLTQLLAENLEKTSTREENSRVVYVGSGVHNPKEPGGDVGSKATLGDMSGFLAGFKAPISMVDSSAFDPDKSYKDSKLCNVMTSIELARRLAAKQSSVTCNVMNPGLIPTTGLFRDLNPLFVFIFTLLTTYVFKVASSEEEGGRRLAYMIANPFLNNVTGAYLSGKPGSQEFNPILSSPEASDEKNGKKIWDLTEAIIKNNI
eukprot:CAMPEP_0119040344 /NCGR_PEP_ID=MMETSP1177-20130426/10235_1 /TAXON_ID=2985 /ORGANISM="Ochromonas sp, Strain CCMP1899" /LENGTH=322 /DNA_ID=CAMNT_0007005295 /DNA_START=77 /DNA_END=1045 /DNA_ORIENTATION=-